MIIANDVTAEGSGFGTDTNKVVIIHKSGKQEDLPLMTKREVADEILGRVAGMMTVYSTNSTPNQDSREIVVDQQGYLERRYVHVPANVARGFLPPIGTAFMVTAGEEQIRVPNGQRDGRVEICLTNWLMQNRIKLGDRLTFSRIGPLQYRLNPAQHQASQK
jgi:hypothetical protein